MRTLLILVCLGLSALASISQIATKNTSCQETWTTTSSGLRHITLRHGTGTPAQMGQEVLIYESMRYSEGTLLFEHTAPKPPVQFRLGANQVIAGVDEGVLGMRTGEIRRLRIPPALSRRSEYPALLSPDSTLIYEIELVQIRPATTGIVLRSDDEGLSWLDVSAGLPEKLEADRVFLQQDRVLLGSRNGGLYEAASGVLFPAWTTSEGSSAFPNDRITGIFPGREGVFTSVFRGGFFRQNRSTGSWSAMHNALRDHTVRAVLETPEALFAGADGGIFRSVDGGASWKQVFTKGQVNSLAESGGVLFAGTWRGVLRSTDAGASWGWVLEDGAVHKTAVIDGRVVVLGMNSQLRYSADKGNSWQRMDLGLLHSSPIFDVEKAGDYLICSHGEGIYRSADWGQHWELVRLTPDGMVVDLAVWGNQVYAVLMSGC